MKTTKSINLFFDKFSFRVSYTSVKELILNELKRLSKETGYGIDKLKIEFKDNLKDDTIAYFSHIGDKPIGFCFYINKFNNTSANKIIDTCRHEFAHYVVCMKNTGHHPENSHGTDWKRACNVLEAKPSPFMSNDRTKHLKTK